MIIAQHKRSENIAEYVLYMWQIEDLIRASNFEIRRIERSVISEMARSEEEFSEIKQWYIGLISEMREKRIETLGHTSDVSEVVGELYFLHNTLYTGLQDSNYIELYDQAREVIKEYRIKAEVPNMNEIDVCFNALYAKLMLKFNKTNISNASDDAFQKMTSVLRYLARSYKQMYTAAQASTV